MLNVLYAAFFDIKAKKMKKKHKYLIVIYSHTYTLIHSLTHSLTHPFTHSHSLSQSVNVLGVVVLVL